MTLEEIGKLKESGEYISLGLGYSASLRRDITGTTIPSDGAWYHLAMVRASASSLLLYVNGAQEANNTTSVSGRTASTRMEVGAYSTSDYNPMNGRVAAIKIYTTNLSASEIQNEMRTYVPQRTANLHIWTPAVENTAGNADNDYSGNGNNWTAGGTLTLEDGPPIVWAYADEDYETYTSAAPPPTALVDLIGMGIIPWAR